MRTTNCDNPLHNTIVHSIQITFVEEYYFTLQLHKIFYVSWRQTVFNLLSF